MPLLLALLAGVITFGRVFGAYQTVTVASHDGARMAATGGTADEVRQVVLEALQAAGLDASSSVTIGPEPSVAGEPNATAAGDAVTVVVTAIVVSPVPFPGVPDTVTLVSRTAMRRE